jgi:exodeoxyribonuclease-1|tara:strand:+ start:4627 stop:6057 length:1431 start_codon:yes stop_codon:yes gene_type:complete
MNLVIWDVETDSSNTFFGTIIEIGAILVNDNFQELDKLNIRCRLPEGTIPQAGALLVNQSSVSLLTKANYSHYQMLQEVETTFKKWSPAIFIGYSNINFDDEMLRKEFFKNLRQPYLTNTNGNKRQDGLNIVRAAYAVDDKVFKTERNEKGNAVMKLESLARMNGIESSGAHNALFDANLTKLVLQKIYRDQNITWKSAMLTGSREEVERYSRDETIFSLNEYFYGKSKLYLVAPLHPEHLLHPVYKWVQTFDLRFDPELYFKMSQAELKVEMKKTPKFLRTIRSNKAPVLLHLDYASKVDPYVALDKATILKRAKLIKNNKDFANRICLALAEIAEEKKDTSDQSDITPEESIYQKFVDNKENSKMANWHQASWEQKLTLLDKFEDERLIDFGKKIIYQEAPQVLPESMFREVKKGIAKRILSTNKEKWTTCSDFYTECDHFREKFSNENNEEKLKFLDEINTFVENIQKKYEAA